MPIERTRRYSVEIRDPDNKSVFFVAADWTQEELRIVIAQNMRLAGLPDDNELTRR